MLTVRARQEGGEYKSDVSSHIVKLTGREPQELVRRNLAVWIYGSSSHCSSLSCNVTLQVESTK